MTLAPLLGDFGSLWDDFRVTLGPLEAYEGDIGPPWVPLEALWGHFGVTLAPLCGDFGPILGI